MASVAFDTHDFIKSLVKAGIDEAQAEAISVGILRAHEASDLATKADVNLAASTLQNELEKNETALRTEIREIQTQMDAKIDKLDAKIDKVELRIEKQMAEMRGTIAKQTWMLTLIIAGIAGLIIKSFFGV